MNLSNCLDSRELALKGRYAEAVTDDGLKRELRRLNMENPNLKLFQLRNHAIRWWSISPNASKTVKATVSNETPAEYQCPDSFIKMSGRYHHLATEAD